MIITVSVVFIYGDVTSKSTLSKIGIIILLEWCYREKPNYIERLIQRRSMAE